MTDKYFLPKYNCLTIAGSDSSGGAGIQADLKTFSALGTFGASVITALTAQNTQGVQAIYSIPSDFVRQQADAVFTDLRIDAVKIGMLADEEIIKTVAKIISEYRPPFVVLDPVMVAKSGAFLLLPQAEAALNEYLIPLVDIITPNLPEAARLLQQPAATSVEQMAQQAQQLTCNKTNNVLIKGGHLTTTTSPDCLLQKDGHLQWFANPRINTQHTHGTGCTLSSAIAALYPQIGNLTEVVRQGKDYVYQAINAGKDLHIGKGVGPLNHFYNLKS